MCHSITSQLIGHNLPWRSFVNLEQSIKESLCSLTITPFLEKHVNDFTILINGSPKVVLLSTNFYENFIDEKDVTITLMPFLQTTGIF